MQRNATHSAHGVIAYEVFRVHLLAVRSEQDLALHLFPVHGFNGRTKVSNPWGVSECGGGGGEG